MPTQGNLQRNALNSRNKQNKKHNKWRNNAEVFPEQALKPQILASLNYDWSSDWPV